MFGLQVKVGAVSLMSHDVQNQQISAIVTFPTPEDAQQVW
jgi:hypothetical protein